MFSRKNGCHVIHRRFIVLVTALASIYSGNSANATGLGFLRGLSWGLERIQFFAPALG